MSNGSATSSISGRPGMSAAVPDVIFVGPDKTGSTWIHDFISSQPEIFAPQSKELFFFNRRFSRGASWYRRQFIEALPHQLTAEVCHDYLTDPGVGKKIRTVCPEARLVLGVRDPLDRIVSSYRYMLLQGRVSMPLADALHEVPELVEHGRYGHWATSILDDFPEARLLTYNFHAMESDLTCFAHWLLATVFELEVSRVDNIPQPSNRARSARSPSVVKAGRFVLEITRKTGGYDLAASLKRRLLESRVLFSSETYRLTDADHAALGSLSSFFRDDLRALDSLLGTDHERLVAQRWEARATDGRP